MKINYPITSKFLEQESWRKKSHSGLDFDMEIGEPLRSIKDGVIYKVADYRDVNAGKTIMVKWNDGKIAIYGHLDKFGSFKEGDKVVAGDLIGYAGNSGHVVSKHGDGSHLHFGIKKGEEYLDPTPYADLIQQMNEPSFLAKLDKLKDTPVPSSDNLFTIGNIFKSNPTFDSGLLHLFKSNFISFVMEVKSFSINLFTLANYPVLVQYFENFFKLFS